MKPFHTESHCEMHSMGFSPFQSAVPSGCIEFLCRCKCHINGYHALRALLFKLGISSAASPTQLPYLGG